MPSLLPGTITESDFSDAVIHIDETDFLAGPEVVLKSTVTDAGATPTSTIRKGNVIVKKTSDGLYYADDGTTNAAGADRNTQASVTALITADATFDSKVISVFVDGVALPPITLGSGDDTDAEVAVALNANAIFAANCVASVVASRVVIKTLRSGRLTSLKVSSNLTTAFGANGTTSHGTDADYLVTEEEVSTLDITGAAVNTPVKTSRKAYYKESALCSSNGAISDEAKTVLFRNGARFG